MGDRGVFLGSREWRKARREENEVDEGLGIRYFALVSVSHTKWRKANRSIRAKPVRREIPIALTASSR